MAFTKRKQRRHGWSRCSRAGWNGHACARQRACRRRRCGGRWAGYASTWKCWGCSRMYYGSRRFPGVGLAPTSAKQHEPSKQHWNQQPSSTRHRCHPRPTRPSPPWRIVFFNQHSFASSCLASLDLPEPLSPVFTSPRRVLDIHLPAAAATAHIRSP
jgi:hypothetical protein